MNLIMERTTIGKREFKRRKTVSGWGSPTEEKKRSVRKKGTTVKGDLREVAEDLLRVNGDAKRRLV